MLHQRIEAMWWNKSNKPNVLLRGLASLYALLSKQDQKNRCNNTVEPPIPMISIGNITVGGSGKTPFVVWLAAELKAKGFQPVLLSRGDGANNQTPHLVSEYSKAREIGDEAVLLYQLTGCPVIAGRDRIAGARLAAEFGDVILLDDGFQYRQLGRVCDIVMVPAEGVGNGCLLPAGPLREPISALSRADIIVRSGTGKCEPLTDVKEWLWSAKSTYIRDWKGVWDMPLENGCSIHVVTAIARPLRVITDLKVMGMTITKHHVFADHHVYNKADVQALSHYADAMVTTAKDAVKLLPLWPNNKPLWVLEQQAEAEVGLAETILKKLQLSKL